ncbi:hypothetical protein IMCC26134_06495 [Verrucomicrobia bacterium IMCC26134]|nr:hypothetical protein IMCC26134_06495 [Verrucomicrobia bacterium IMCC26134]
MRELNSLCFYFQIFRAIKFNAARVVNRSLASMKPESAGAQVLTACLLKHLLGRVNPKKEL